MLDIQTFIIILCVYIYISPRINPKGGIGIFHIINPGGDLRLRLGIRELESHGPDAREPMAHDQQDEEEANQRELLIWDRHRLGKLGEYDDFDTVDLVG